MGHCFKGLESLGLGFLGFCSASRHVWWSLFIDGDDLRGFLVTGGGPFWSIFASKKRSFFFFFCELRCVGSRHSLFG